MSDKDTKENKQTPNSSKMYFDGDCPMCRNFSAYTGDTTVAQHDFRSEKLPNSISLEQASGALHYVDELGNTHKGAAAVLHVLSKKRFWKLFSIFWLLPPFIYLAQAVYGVVAKHRFLLFGSLARLSYIKLIVIIACLLPMLISPKLWQGNLLRNVATSPIITLPPSLFEFSTAIYLESVLYLLAVFLLVCSLLYLNIKHSLSLFLVVIATSSILDQNRLMPYYLEFYFFFFLLITFPWPDAQIRQRHVEVQNSIIPIIALILCCIWGWSGLHKLNITYLMVGFPWFISPVSTLFSAETKATLDSLAILTPLIEFGAAFALLFKTSRKIGVLGITAMHCLVLALLGPLGHNYNSSVWSWNVAHILLCWLVFYRSTFSISEILIPRSFVHLFALIWFGLTPALIYFVNWPPTLSYSLYTWNNSVVELETSTLEALPEYIPEQMKSETITSVNKVDFQAWIYQELNSPAFDSSKNFIDIFDKVCGDSQKPEMLKLVIKKSPNFLTGKRIEQSVNCP